MKKDKINVAVLVSGGGTNLQALIDAEKNGIIKNAKISVVISSNKDAYALQRAKGNSIDAYVVEKKRFETQGEYEIAMFGILDMYDTDLIVLAGFLNILSDKFVQKFANRIINVHPSLIPSFCGEGFYGLKVHEEALKKGVKVTGATVHFVNKNVDDGEIIEQKAVRVLDGDTPEILQQRVMKEAEHIILPQSVEKIARGILESS